VRTEDLVALGAATDAFGVRVEVEDHDPGDTGYEVAHTAVTYVVDDAGRVVVEWPFGTESAVMASDMEILLEEAQP
jgi:cytochrome oxidase Cu insertion factor (SCO1/SenC/PrrC family)